MNIIQHPSPNHWNGRFGWTPDMIVCHITDGAYDGAIATLCDPAMQRSSHFVVARDGRITQLVQIADGAWCNGTDTKPLANSYYGKSTLQAVRDRKTNANYYTISIEFEGIWKETKGRLTDVQLAAGIELIKYIFAEVKRLYGIDIPVDREHIVGHYQISPVTRPCCPGELFQWDELLAGVKGEAAETDWQLKYTKLEAEYNAFRQGVAALLDNYKEV
ncbi:N-acetylmuramoyl-L-alanine amidase [Acetanaerobacterium elongatum]|uniref:N-acetylmuramoyl-L-alanine amidase n=1 Tax=Acetanaerobacterium elongatum TaxID=258515 RepID=A0A1G9Z503_9FIRM|nr:N-acetylmuramoyl-L-alanine amidase [Acetanaerobacterium elongatum]SDN15753.1 N-acetyl-anhydromuramyl-L-alanine amidase AmpD [Acetanaerobacterium elongatum]